MSCPVDGAAPTTVGTQVYTLDSVVQGEGEANEAKGGREEVLQKTLWIASL